MLVLAVYGLSQKRFDLEEMTLFQRLVVEVVAPVQKGLTQSRLELDNLVNNYVRIVNTSKENEFLRQKIERLESDLFQMEEIRRENFRLKQMLNYSEDIGQEKILAQVIGWDSANQFKVLRLNRGSNDGIKLMSPVITHLGLVGYIYRIGANYADVLTILDPNNRVDALSERTRTHGIVEGVFNYRCALKYVSRTEPIEVGDKLMTAGVGGIYPKGIKVGMITDIDRETSGMTLGVEITPSVDFRKLEEVIVILPRAPVTAQAELPASTTQGKGN
ncbi:MAG: rod shape-determining protein MreC [Bacteriovoracia bacterium]